MNKLTLSPTLFDICNKSRSFRDHYYWNTLNVCNVIRSLLWVLLVQDVLPAAIVFVVLNSVLQLVFSMCVNGIWDPYDAMTFIIESLRASPASFDSLRFWIMLLSTASSGLLVVIGTGVVTVIPAFFAILGTWKGLKVLLGSRATEKAVCTVLGPLEIVGEYIASKHSKFCRNVEAEVVHRLTYAEELRARMERDLEKHWYAVKEMSIPELLASIERNRAILSKHA